MTRYTLITGVSGYVGEFLARHLTAQGRTVAGTFLSTPIQIPGVACVPVDFSDARAVKRLFRDMKPTEVVHCAAATNGAWCEQWPAEAKAAIFDATTNLARAMAEHTPEASLVNFSTDLVFDGEEAPYDEDATPKPLSRYGSLKTAAEKEVASLERATTLRTALVYGPQATIRSSFLGWMVNAMAQGEPLTLFTDEWRTPIFIDDLCRAVEVLLDRIPEGGVARTYHAGGEERLNRVEIGEQVAAAFGLPAEVILPVQRADAGSTPPRVRDVALRCSRLRSLGWSPTPFAQGIKESHSRWNALRPA